MRVFITGATGTVGWPIAQELMSKGYEVIALARSEASANRLREIGATPLMGDISNPAPWIGVLGDIDAIIHAAATFGDDMGAIDDQLIASFIIQAAKHSKKMKFIYTGGSWLYGETGARPATEISPLKPIQSFEWMARNMKTVLESSVFHTCIIHPACVYDQDNGVTARFVRQAKGNTTIEVWGSPDIHWPMVHRQDLARAYRLVLEKGEPGHCYNVASEQSVRVADMVRAIQARFNNANKIRILDIDIVAQTQGNWVYGTVMDQRMSSAKITSELGWSPDFPDTCAVLSG